MVSAVSKRHSNNTTAAAAATTTDEDDQLFYTHHMTHLYQQVVRILIVEIFTKAVFDTFFFVDNYMNKKEKISKCLA